MLRRGKLLASLGFVVMLASGCQTTQTATGTPAAFDPLLHVYLKHEPDWKSYIKFDKFADGPEEYNRILDDYMAAYRPQAYRTASGNPTLLAKERTETEAHIRAEAAKIDPAKLYLVKWSGNLGPYDEGRKAFPVLRTSAPISEFPTFRVERKTGTYGDVIPNTIAIEIKNMTDLDWLPMAPAEAAKVFAKAASRGVQIDMAVRIDGVASAFVRDSVVRGRTAPVLEGRLVRATFREDHTIRPMIATVDIPPKQ